MTHRWRTAEPYWLHTRCRTEHCRSLRPRTPGRSARVAPSRSADRNSRMRADHIRDRGFASSESSRGSEEGRTDFCFQGGGFLHWDHSEGTRVRMWEISPLVRHPPVGARPGDPTNGPPHAGPRDRMLVRPLTRSPARRRRLVLTLPGLRTRWPDSRGRMARYLQTAWRARLSPVGDAGGPRRNRTGRLVGGPVLTPPAPNAPMRQLRHGGG